MQDQDLLRNLQKEIVENFCEPIRGEQKEECVNYYDKQIRKEEEQTDEQQMKILTIDLSMFRLLPGEVDNDLLHSPQGME